MGCFPGVGDLKAENKYKTDQIEVQTLSKLDSGIQIKIIWWYELLSVFPDLSPDGWPSAKKRERKKKRTRGFDVSRLSSFQLVQFYSEHDKLYMYT